MARIKKIERVKVLEPPNGGYYSHDFVKQGIEFAKRLVRILCVRNIRIVEPDIQKSILAFLRGQPNSEVELLTISPEMSDEVIDSIRKTLPNPASTANEFRQDIITNRNHIRRLIMDLGALTNRFTYKEYKELPLVHFCQFDDKIHMGVQFFDDGLGVGALAKKCFVFNSTSKLGKGVVDQFQTLISGSFEVCREFEQPTVRRRIINGERISVNELPPYDVFLCHNSSDKAFVRIIYDELKKIDVIPWLDEVVLPAGRPWQTELENSITSINAAAVFIGENGLGPWQQHEIRAFLAEFTNRNCPVIPVVLPNAKDIPELPIFLNQMTWIDLRKDFPTGIQKIANSIK